VRTLEPVRTVEVLGPVRVAGAPLTSPTQLILLSVLASAAPEAVPFNRLVDAVWDEPPPSAENSLHSHLARLRRALGPGSVVREGAAYRLALPTDAAQFVALVEDPPPADPAARRRDLTDALALWRGTPFGDCSAHRFLRSSVDALTTARSRAVRELAGLDLADGDPLAAVTTLQGLVATQPLDEESWALLVEALHVSGRRADALRAVQQAFRSLAKVGLEPSGRLRDAEAAVLQSAPALRGRAEVPRPTGRLIGRAELIDTVTALVRSPGWATLVGPGGVGKTRLAIETVGLVDGPVVFCDLTEIDAADIEVTLARAASVPLRPRTWIGPQPGSGCRGPCSCSTAARWRPRASPPSGRVSGGVAPTCGCSRPVGLRSVWRASG
jgi:DNA-binding SARP family transcriptional activator